MLDGHEPTCRPRGTQVAVTKLYFAYGSNMSRQRLEERTGIVVPHGRALLAGYEHHFSHCGQDGSAKGNIGACLGMQVHGVLYGLKAAQVELLHPYESGYEVIAISVALPGASEAVQAYTYCNPTTHEGLTPLSSYFEHYMRGMLENDFPAHYIARLRKQSGL